MPRREPAPTENVLAAIHALSNRIGRAFQAEIEGRHGLTLPEWRVMLSARRHPGIEAGLVAEAWGMDKMTISRAVRRLERAGRLVRRPARGDRRRRRLTLTPAGRALHAAIEPEATRRYRAFLAPLSTAERRALARALARLLAAAP
jgi:DNA-binding MarR family transcriptional regulator